MEVDPQVRKSIAALRSHLEYLKAIGVEWIPKGNVERWSLTIR